MRLLPIFIIFFSAKTFGSMEIWKNGDQFFEFIRFDNSGILTTANCEKKECEALKILKTISFKNLSSEKFWGGKNPGAVLCHEIKTAQVVFLRDLSGNDNSFCRFPDKSMISSGSLEMKARENDKK